MDTTFYAHTGNEADKSDWQGLREHLEAVAEEGPGTPSPFASSQDIKLGSFDPRLRWRRRLGIAEGEDEIQPCLTT